MRVSPRSVQKAAAIKKMHPELFADVRSGKTHLDTAASLMKNQKGKTEKTENRKADVLKAINGNEDIKRETQEPDGKNKPLDLSDITGLLGGIRPALELTRQEFKILNQAVNPQCSGNEESVFALKFIQSIKTRYRDIKQVT